MGGRRGGKRRFLTVRTEPRRWIVFTQVFERRLPQWRSSNEDVQSVFKRRIFVSRDAHTSLLCFIHLGRLQPRNVFFHLHVCARLCLRLLGNRRAEVKQQSEDGLNS